MENENKLHETVAWMKHSGIRGNMRPGFHFVASGPPFRPLPGAGQFA